MEESGQDVEKSLGTYIDTADEESIKFDHEHKVAVINVIRVSKDDIDAIEKELSLFGYELVQVEYCP